MATTNTTKAKAEDSSPIMAKWNGEDVEVFNGADLVDKSEMVGVAFRITGLKIDNSQSEGTNKDLVYAWVEGEREDGTLIMFNDASTGIKVQVLEWMKAKNFSGELGVWYDVSTLCPRGLRISKYIKKVNGKDIPAQTYYLTGDGRRRG